MHHSALGTYKDFCIRDQSDYFTKVYSIAYGGGRTTGIVALELASGLMSFNLMTIEGILATLTASLLSLSDNPVVAMIFMNIVLLVAGALGENSHAL